MHGHPSGDGALGSDESECSARSLDGIGSFVRDDGGATTIAAAVAILVSLTLVFGLATASWVGARSADVQAVADAGALAGMNTLAEYATAAQVLDALVLSLGLVGLLTMAIGLVMCAIPLVDVAGPPVVEAATKVFEARKKLSQSAAQGLQHLEAALPYAMAASSFATIRANTGESGNYVGLAVPFPTESASNFGQLDADDVGTRATDALNAGKRVDEATQKASESKKLADAALTRGWLADCGGNPSMRERANSLAGLSGARNPSYPTSAGWSFQVGIERARTYYAQRLANEGYTGDNVEELTRSSARAVFYRYALSQVNASSFSISEDGFVSMDIRELPSNTQEVRATELYTDALWPCTQQPEGLVLHASLSCPGATGSSAGTASLADQESGRVGVCSVCGFTVTDVGRAPAPSTSIDNGFEHWWREFVRAAQDYQVYRNEQAVQEQAAREEAESARDAFKEALESLSSTRVKLAPPGRYGCVCVVADAGTHLSPKELSSYVGSADLPPRVAVAGAALARDPASQGNTVLGGFFDSLVAQSGAVGGIGSVLDAVMSGWGDLLVSYDTGYDAFMEGARESFEKLSTIGLDGVAQWLRDALDSAIELTAIQPADMSTKKPVLADTNDVMHRSGNDWYEAVHALVMAAPAIEGAGDLSEGLAALGVYVEELTGSDTIEVATFTIPGTDIGIPLKIDFGWLSELAAQ